MLLFLLDLKAHIKYEIKFKVGIYNLTVRRIHYYIYEVINNVLVYAYM